MFPSKTHVCGTNTLVLRLHIKLCPPITRSICSYICIHSCLIKLLVIAHDYFFKDKYYPLVAFTHCDLVINLYEVTHYTRAPDVNYENYMNNYTCTTFLITCIHYSVFFM